MTLTKEEVLILLQAIQGVSNADIGKELGLTPIRVQARKTRIYKKLNAPNLEVAAKNSIKQGVFKPVKIKKPAITPQQSSLLDLIAQGVSNERMRVLLKLPVLGDFEQLLQDTFDTFQVRNKVELMLLAASCGYV